MNRVTTTSTLALALGLLLAACTGDSLDPVSVGASAPTAQTTTEGPGPVASASEDVADEQQPPPATAGAADRTIEVEMRDIAFSVSELEVTAGETIRFVFTNTGEARHEAVVGDEHVQAAHADQMADGMTHEGMSEGHHGEAPAVSLAPGETGDLVVTFEEPGDMLIGCHEPGHYDAGMVIAITVRP